MTRTNMAYYFSSAAAPGHQKQANTKQNQTCPYTSHAIKLISQYFIESPKLHYFYKGKESCKKLCDGRFKHKWILDREVGYCEQTGLRWLVYEEENGMFCLLCGMHDRDNPLKHENKVYPGHRPKIK